MLEREVIGIDHGNRNMKTVHTDFSAAITKLEVRPDNLENVLEFQGQCFKIGEGAPELETVDKTQNMNYYLLTLAALAKELHYRGKTEALVRIGAALPPRRYGLQKNDFKKYLLQSKNLKFRYEGRNYHVEIENVHIFMQGHVIVLLHQEELMGECVLCDMGGGTNDIMGLVDGKPTGQLFIDKNAALTCINHIREVVEAKTGENISTYVLEKFMVNGDYDCSDAYRNIIQGELKQYAEQIYFILKKFGYNLELTKIVFGGRFNAIQHFGKNEGKKVLFYSDIHENAKGCEMAVRSILKEIAKKTGRGIMREHHGKRQDIQNNITALS